MSLLNSDLGSVRPMNASDLSMVLRWRNHVDIRKYMYTQHEISVEEHASWFKRTSDDDSKHCLIFEWLGKAVGFASLYLHDDSLSADWGFYIDPLVQQKGVGMLLGRAVLDYAFEDLKLLEVCGQVISSNKRSIAFHLKLGFKGEENSLNRYDDVNLYNIVCFRLRADQWGVTQ